jgi:hypothetical protein
MGGCPSAVVWDRLESASGKGGVPVVRGVLRDWGRASATELGVKQGGLVVRDSLAKARESWS